MRIGFIITLLLLGGYTTAQTITIIGKIRDAQSGLPLSDVNVHFNEGSASTASTGKGNYQLSFARKHKTTVSFSRIGYQSQTKTILSKKDTVHLNISLQEKSYELPGVNVLSEKEPDTVFGSWKYYIDDFDFYEDKLILLTRGNTIFQSEVILADSLQHVLSNVDIPDVVQHLFKDYMGNINIVCDEHVYRVKVVNNKIRLASLPTDAFKQRIVPGIDTIGSDIYFSNYSRDYPQFNYYAYNSTDSAVKQFCTITDIELLQKYNMEFYFLKPWDRLMASKLSQEYHIDKHRIAAVMSGYTQSVFYTPLYAPLAILKDTVYIFDHYTNAILKYNKYYQKIDSLPIKYNHPKNWRDWKHKLFTDKEACKVYALYERYGNTFLKNIDLQTGNIISTYQLINKYVKNIKVKNGFVYYVYRPFESQQHAFVYKEKINYP